MFSTFLFLLFSFLLFTRIDASNIIPKRSKVEGAASMCAYVANVGLYEWDGIVITCGGDHGSLYRWNIYSDQVESLMALPRLD